MRTFVLIFGLSWVPGTKHIARVETRLRRISFLLPRSKCIAAARRQADPPSRLVSLDRSPVRSRSRLSRSHQLILTNGIDQEI